MTAKPAGVIYGGSGQAPSAASGGQDVSLASTGSQTVPAVVAAIALAATGASTALLARRRAARRDGHAPVR